MWFRFNVVQMMDRTGGQAMRNLLTIESAHYFTYKLLSVSTLHTFTFMARTP